jgi:hypothetical protein
MEMMKQLKPKEEEEDAKGKDVGGDDDVDMIAPAPLKAPAVTDKNANDADHLLQYSMLLQDKTAAAVVDNTFNEQFSDF